MIGPCNLPAGRAFARLSANAMVTLMFAVTLLANATNAADNSTTRGLLEITGTKTPYLVQYLVPGSDFLGIHGLTFDKHDQLYVGSVVGQAIYALDTRSDESSTFISPPQGLADDLEFGPDGSLVWTSILTGQVFVRRPDGHIEILAEDLPGINSVAFRADGRLFVTQVLWGDALWELDLSGKHPPRKILSGIGHLNGFDFDREGYLYGPLLHKGIVVRVDVDSAQMTTVASGFAIPAAVNFDSADNLYVVDTGLGRIIRIDIANGEKTLVATVDAGIDNLAFDSKDRLFISNMVDNAVYQINSRTGAARTIVRSELSVPGGLDVVSEDGIDQVYLGDLFSYCKVNGDTGTITEIKRGLRDHMEFPMAVNVQGEKVVTASWFTDAVEIFDRRSGRSLAVYHDLKDPVDALVLDNGDIVVAEQGTGRLLVIDGSDRDKRKIVAENLPGMAAMRAHSNDEVYVTDVVTGELLRVNIRTGKKTVISAGLDRPEGFDVAPDGSIVLAEVGKQRLLRIDSTSGATSEIARNLAIGYPGAKGSPPAYVATGVGVSANGAIYVSSDLNTALYKITAQ